LKDVAKRKDRAWLARFILDPPAMIQSGDAYGKQLLDQARGVVMPKLTGLTPEKAETLLDLIEAESKLEQSQFVGLAFSTEPFTAQDIERGRVYFTGLRRLEGGGAACISCHTTHSLGMLGGGRLGPDLSLVFERLQGRKNLSAWLFAPATPTMQSVFQPHPLTRDEIHALVAFLENAAQHSGEADMSGPLAFLILGLGGSVIGLIGMDWIWRARFRGVRRPLVLHSEPAWNQATPLGVASGHHD
jgi:hypothetical protein